MTCTITQEKVFKFLEWIFFIGFTIVAGWFASGVLEHFFSRKTGFTQHEEEVTNYPVIIMQFVGYKESEVNQSNVKISYTTKGMKARNHLKFGENYFQHEECNKIEKVFLEGHEDFEGLKIFRIILKTPILLKKRPFVNLKMFMHTQIETRNGSVPEFVMVHITTEEKSPGIYFGWQDGIPLRFAITKNTHVMYEIQPQITKYLEPLGKCQKESYYKCITSHLDVIEYNECSKKCMPNLFSNIGNNYSTEFCQNDTDSQRCILNYMMKQEIGSNCKKTCSQQEYFGNVVSNIPVQPRNENWNYYGLVLELTNQDLLSKVYEEYLIYDFIGMIGSVGGTLGIHNF